MLDLRRMSRVFALVGVASNIVQQQQQQLSNPNTLEAIAWFHRTHSSM